MKALQFMALEIPTFCAPVGVNSMIIRQKENGLLASTDDEWVDSLSRPMNSAELRSKLGREGRATIEVNDSKAVHAPRVFRILEAALDNERQDIFAEVDEQPASKVEIVGASVLNDKVDA